VAILIALLHFYAPFTLPSGLWQQLLLFFAIAAAASLYKPILSFLTLKQNYLTRAITYSVLIFAFLAIIDLVGFFNVNLLEYTIPKTSYTLISLNIKVLSPLVAAGVYSVISGFLISLADSLQKQSV